jgi:hypothetical protein
METPRAPAVTIREAGLRDGLQSIARTLPTEMKTEWLRAAHAAGVREFEVGSFVPPRLLPQLADTAPLVEAAVKLPGLVVSVLVPNLNGADARDHPRRRALRAADDRRLGAGDAVAADRALAARHDDRAPVSGSHFGRSGPGQVWLTRAATAAASAIAGALVSFETLRRRFSPSAPPGQGMKTSTSSTTTAP